ncbi:hypothetical protein [Sutcliffiella horikoshii]|uniref:hypothetical protein n=1 Tax=Sutcliffiella horikoshii TaxID=79883 RepID=UPI001F3ABB2E|nr:hypothetical protein [Sutcliffiella horikoshii]MCG1023211.1 hypothetical protein [Sutcliffiella horikoshii]
MNSFFLPSLISKKQALQSIQSYQNNWITKWQSVVSSKKKLTSMERVYLPYWCYDYEYTSLQMKEPICGKVAVETGKQLTAILPSTAALEEIDVSADEMTFLDVSGDPELKVAEDAIYWEAFTREKKRKDIQVTITETNLLFVPYWIGYVQGKSQIELIIVDATSGKVDLGIKDAMIQALMAGKEKKIPLAR